MYVVSHTHIPLVFDVYTSACMHMCVCAHTHTPTHKLLRGN